MLKAGLDITKEGGMPAGLVRIKPERQKEHMLSADNYIPKQRESEEVQSLSLSVSLSNSPSDEMFFFL